jgi:hypothetical protein
MIGPTDLLNPSPAPHFKTFQVFLIYCPFETSVNICGQQVITPQKAQSFIIIDTSSSTHVVD